MTPVNGCGAGGVTWSYVIRDEYGGLDPEFSLFGLTGGPLGHVAIGAYGNPSYWTATVYIVDHADASPASIDEAHGQEFAGEVGLDRTDGVMFAGHDELPFGQGSEEKFHLGPSSFDYQWSGLSSGYQVGDFGCDAARECFVSVSVSTNNDGGGVNFGLGVISGDYLLHYDATGKLVSQTAGTWSHREAETRGKFLAGRRVEATCKQQRG